MNNSEDITRSVLLTAPIIIMAILYYEYGGEFFNKKFSAEKIIIIDDYGTIKLFKLNNLQNKSIRN